MRNKYNNIVKQILDMHDRKKFTSCGLEHGFFKISFASLSCRSYPVENIYVNYLRIYFQSLQYIIVYVYLPPRNWVMALMA